MRSRVGHEQIRRLQTAHVHSRSISGDDSVVGSAFGFDFCNSLTGFCIDDVPCIFFERWNIECLSIGKDGHAVAAVSWCHFPNSLFIGEIDTVEFFGSRKVEPIGYRVSANTFDVARFLQSARRCFDASDKLVVFVHVEHQYSRATVLQVISDSRCDDVEKSFWQ